MFYAEIQLQHVKYAAAKVRLHHHVETLQVCGAAHVVNFGNRRHTRKCRFLLFLVASNARTCDCCLPPPSPLLSTLLFPFPSRV